MKNDFKCSFPKCYMKFKYLSDLKEHMKKHYRIEILRCSKCNKSFTSQFIMKNHISSHLKSHPFSCFEEKCKSSFVNLSLLKFHYKKNHFKEENKGESWFETEFNQKIERKKEEIEGKIRNYQENYDKFIKKYPIIDVSYMEKYEKDDIEPEKAWLNEGKTEEINEEKDNIVLLGNKRKKEEKIEKEEKENFTKDEKILLFLLNLFKTNLNSEAFDVLVSTLERYVY